MRHGGIVKQIGRCAAENLGIAAPTVAFAGGAVSGQVGVVVFGAPDGVLHKFVQQRVGAFQPAGALHIRVDRHGGKVLRGERHVGFDQNILKAENRKGGLILVDTVLAGVADLLQRRGDLFVGALDVFLRELAVFVQHFAKAQVDLLPGAGGHGKPDIPGHILPEIQHGLARRRGEQCRGKLLMLGHGHVVRGGRRDMVAGAFCPAAVAWHGVGVHRFAVLVVGKANRAVVRPRPVGIGANRLHAAVCAGNFQLRQQLGFGTVLVEQPPRAAAAAVPTVRQLHGKCVFAVLQKVGHIVGLVLHTLAVVGDAGCQNHLAHALPVEPCLIQAARRYVQPRLAGALHSKVLGKAIHGIALFFVGRIVAGDPACLPAVQPGFKKGGFRLTGDVVFVPKLHRPLHPRLGGQGCAAPRGTHGTAWHLAAVPQAVRGIVRRRNAVGGLRFAARTVPVQAGRCKIHA